MRKRIFMLMALALMLVAAMALSGVAQAASPSSLALKCQQEALLGSDYNYIGGNAKKSDNFDRKATAGKDVFCGFGGYDSITTLGAGDYFLGGDGNDYVNENYGSVTAVESCNNMSPCV